MILLLNRFHCYNHEKDCFKADQSFWVQALSNAEIEGKCCRSGTEISKTEHTEPLLSLMQHMSPEVLLDMFIVDNKQLIPSAVVLPLPASIARSAGWHEAAYSVQLTLMLEDFPDTGMTSMSSSVLHFRPIIASAEEGMPRETSRAAVMGSTDPQVQRCNPAKTLQ